MGQAFGRMKLAATGCPNRHPHLCGSRWVVDTGKGRKRTRVCYMCGYDRATAKLYRARKVKASLPARQGSQSSKRIKAVFPKPARKQSRRRAA